jgi:hypothetical protein
MEKKLVRAYWNIVQSTVILFFGVVFFGAIGVLLLKFQIDNPDNPKRLFGIIFGFAIIGFSLFTLRYFFKIFPTVTITTERIILKSAFKRQEINLKDIQSIGLMGKSPMTFLFITMPVESTTIMTKNLNEVIIWDDFYQNIDKIKYALEKIKGLIDEGQTDFSKLPSLIIEEKSKNHLNDNRFEQYLDFKGLWIINYRGIMFYGMIAFFIVMIGIKGNPNSGSIYFLSGISAFWYLVFGYQFFYYKLSDNFLLIKNHLWPWVNRTYKLGEIKEIIFEAPGKLPNSIKVRTNNYKIRLFPGASLRDKTFKEFETELTKRGVVVRNELLID